MKKKSFYPSLDDGNGLYKLLLIMKISTFIFLISFINVSANIFSQEKISVDLKNVTVKDVFAEIEQNSEFKFLYRNELVNVNREVSIKAKNETIETILAKLFDMSDLTFKVFDDNLVVITSKSIQQKKVTGIVTDTQTGEPLPGVNVIIEGTTLGTTTDLEGKYSIEIPGPNAVLIFSSIGYISERIQLAGQETLNAKLVADVTNLEEVIVVGYGTQKKSDVTGSVATVSKERLKYLPVTNVLQAIQGSVGGVSITQTSNVPGSAQNVIIRGQNSITAQSNPLVVVDGIPLMSGSLNDINPNDIESTEILKDASSTAIYGTRGSAGVILVTTKRGTTGKPVIKYSGYAGPEKMVNVFKPMNGPQYVRKYLTSVKQNNVVPPDSVPTASEIANYHAGKTTDWIKESSQQGFIQDHNLSISGGTKDVKYYVSGDYLKDQGVLKGYQYTRVSLRSNIDANVTSWMSIGASLFYINNNQDGGRVNLMQATQMSPYGQLYDAYGNYFIIPMTNQTLYPNPLLGTYDPAIRRSNNIGGNFYAEIKPAFIKGLSYKLNGGYNYNPSRNSDYYGRSQNNLNGSAQVSTAEANNWIVENIIGYDKSFGKHHIQFTGLYSAQENTNLRFGLNSNTFVNDLLEIYNMNAGAVQSVTSSYTKSNYVSQMGRINYSFASKYLLTLTARRDGYSAFGSNTNKFATFPSVAIGWNIASEDFFKSATNIVSLLKLRASYGKAGNQAIDPYRTLSTSGTVQYVYNSQTATGVTASNLGNSNLSWENTTGLNLGLDFGLYNGRINGSLELYKAQTNDLLLNRNLPGITGFGNILDNIGKTENKGIEITLSSVNIRTNDFMWETNINFTANRNKIVSLYGDSKDDIGNRWFIGKPVGAVYDYVFNGIWQVGDEKTIAKMDPGAKPGDLRFRDLTGDSLINDKDRAYLGSSNPDWTGGMTNTFRYKNFRLNIFIQTLQGGIKNNPVLNFADQAQIINLPESVGYWTAENKSNSRPSLRIGANVKGYGYPSNQSYTRIKDITLSYSFPKSIIDKLNIGELTMYISGRNLYTFTKWKGWDPENNFRSDYTTNFNNYPNVASFVFGVNLTLL